MNRHDLALAGCVAAGGAIGSVGRYAVGLLALSRLGVGFPVGTLAVNVTGSLAIGMLLRWASVGAGIAPELRLFLVTGVCGGYTTFSAFSAEVALMLEDGAAGQALLYVASSVLLSVAATFAGFAIARAAMAGQGG